LCIDARILSEYHDVLRRPKFHFEEDKVITVIDYIEHNSQNVAASPLSASLPDPDDEPFLEVALKGRAECLITGNQSYFPSGLCQGVTVISPADFIKFFLKRQKTGK
jgi:uncharacterized protein